MAATISSQPRRAEARAHVASFAPTRLVTPTASFDPSAIFLTFAGQDQGPPVLESRSLTSGSPTARLAELGGLAPVLGSGTTLWVTRSVGPRERNDTAGGDPEPNSCAGDVVRVDLSTGTETTVQTFPSSTLVGDAVPSPDEGEVVFKVAPCARSYFNEHLLVEDHNTGRSWTIGAKARVCHWISTPSWDANGTGLIFTFAPSNPAEPVGKYDGYGICTQELAGEIEVLAAAHPAALSSAQIIKAPRGCSYLSAVFDPEGIAAIEACEHGAPRGFSRHGEYNGDAYVVQLSAQGRSLHRVAIKPEPNPATLARNPSGGPVLVSEELGENTRPYFNWIWTFNGQKLRLLSRSTESITAIAG
jgi:hypothetical protein